MAVGGRAQNFGAKNNASQGAGKEIRGLIGNTFNPTRDPLGTRVLGAQNLPNMRADMPSRMAVTTMTGMMRPNPPKQFTDRIAPSPGYIDRPMAMPPGRMVSRQPPGFRSGALDQVAAAPAKQIMDRLPQVASFKDQSRIPGMTGQTVAPSYAAPRNTYAGLESRFRPGVAPQSQAQVMRAPGYEFPRANVARPAPAAVASNPARAPSYSAGTQESPRVTPASIGFRQPNRSPFGSSFRFEREERSNRQFDPNDPAYLLWLEQQKKKKPTTF